MSLEKPLNKEKANIDLYYNIFANNIGKFENGQNVLFVDIGNFDVYYKFIVNNMNCNYIIIDQPLKENLLKACFPNINITFIGAEDNSIIKALENLNMKFDKIIMNPPYNKNLHLKILAKAIGYLTEDEDGICISLSPIRWLQDLLAKYKKNSDRKRFEDSVIKHIENIDVISAAQAQQLFSNVMNFNLGIYKCVNKKTSFNPDQMLNQIILKSILMLKSEPVIEKNKKDGWRVRVPLITGGESGGSGKRKLGLRSFGKLLYFYNGIKDGKPWYDHYMKNQYSKNTPEITASIKFKSEIECKNFISSISNTNFGKYYTHDILKDVNVFEKSFLWMGDCINPRTGLKGYESEWTDEDFYTYFNITKEEQELIEKTMEKYK